MLLLLISIYDHWTPLYLPNLKWELKINFDQNFVCAPLWIIGLPPKELIEAKTSKFLTMIIFLTTNPPFYNNSLKPSRDMMFSSCSKWIYVQ